MKKVLVLCSMLATSGAFAQAGLSFGDQNYFLKKSQFNLVSNLNLEYYTFKQQDSGTAGTTYNKEGYYSRSDVAYALTDKFNVFAGADYVYHNESFYEIGTNNSAYHYNDGLVKTRLGANYRLLNQDQSLVNLDFGVVARLNLVDATLGESTGSNATPRESVDGNGAGIDGRNSSEINARIGRKWNEANEWQAAFGVVQNYEGTRYQRHVSTAKTKYTQDASTDYYVRAVYQYRPIQEFMMNFMIQGNFISQKTEKTGTTKLNYDERFGARFAFTAKYLVTETFIIRANLAKDALSTYSYKTGATRTSIRAQHTNLYGLGVDWLF